MKPRELKKILKLVKSMGVSRIHLPGVLEAEFHAEVKAAPKKVKSKVYLEPEGTPALSSEVAETEPTEDEMLLWSTGSFDEIRASRAKKETE